MAKATHRVVLVQDDPIKPDEIVALAQLQAKEDRKARINQWVADRHISVHDSAVLGKIGVRIDDIWFDEETDIFPSLDLIAKIALAIHTGHSDKTRFFIHDYKYTDKVSLGDLYDDPRYRKAPRK